MQTDILSTQPKYAIFALTNHAVSTPIVNEEAIFLDSEIPVVFEDDTSSISIPDSTSHNYSAATEQKVKKVSVPVIDSIKSVSEGAMATVIQIWEGVVISVDRENALMTVRLKDRSNLIEEHIADIDLQWVGDQDEDLLVSGSVFYWTIYKETNRGSIKNSQELRFRRLPNWTRMQIKAMEEDVELLSSKLSASRVAE